MHRDELTSPDDLLFMDLCFLNQCVLLSVENTNFIFGANVIDACIVAVVRYYIRSTELKVKKCNTYEAEYKASLPFPTFTLFALLLAFL
jgi:Ca2+/Na+ antiporter